MDADLNSTDSDNDDHFRASAVMPATSVFWDIASLVNELVVRLHSLTRPNSGRARFGLAIAMSAEFMWESAVRESSGWWIDNELEHLTSSEHRHLILEILSRGFPDGALLAISAFAPDRLWPLQTGDVDVMIGWYQLLAPDQRALSNALAQRVMARWLHSQPAGVAFEILQRWLDNGSPELVHVALTACWGLFERAASHYVKFIPGLLATVGNIVRQQNAGSEAALGWLLGYLWCAEPQQVEVWLTKHSGLLSRKVFRLSVARIPSDRRRELIGAWKASHKRV